MTLKVALRGGWIQFPLSLNLDLNIGGFLNCPQVNLGPLAEFKPRGFSVSKRICQQTRSRPS